MENKTVNFGLIAGGSVVVILFIMDLINNRMMVSIGMNYFPTLILLIAMILSVREAKKDYEVLEFSEAFKHAFLPFVIGNGRSEEHTSELQSRGHLVCRLLLEK